MHKKKFVVDLKQSVHRHVEIKLEKSLSCDCNRAATIKFISDGMDIKLYVMESDLRILATEILKETSAKSDH